MNRIQRNEEYTPWESVGSPVYFDMQFAMCKLRIAQYFTEKNWYDKNSICYFSQTVRRNCSQTLANSTAGKVRLCNVT